MSVRGSVATLTLIATISLNGLRSASSLSVGSLLYLPFIWTMRPSGLISMVSWVVSLPTGLKDATMHLPFLTFST